MKRNKFSLSHYKLISGDFGALIPITWFEVLPGDTIQHQAACLIRMARLLTPVMHPCRVRIHNWYVPYRLIWEDAEDFFTGGEDGTSAPAPPYITLSGAVAVGSMHDYLGVPVENFTTNNINVSALPFRAWNLIYNEHYRDQDLISPGYGMSTASGADATTNTVLYNISWEKDYFTTSRPWESKGDEIHIPVVGIGKENQVFTAGPSNPMYESDGNSRTYDFYQEIDPATVNESFFVDGDAASGGYPDIHVRPSDLRLAMGMHRFLERRGKFGSRYQEYLRFLGIRPDDARIGAPEYLGGGRQVISFSEVLATDDANTGKMKGHGIAAIKSNRYRRFIPEHGLVMSMLSIIPKHILSEGLPRHFSRLSNKEEYFQHELQGIGEQEVYNKELFTPSATADDVFGYQRRYEEYKTGAMYNGIAGEFNIGSTSDDWHIARHFGAQPTLNSSFVLCVPPTRHLASAGDDQFYCMAHHSVQARRMMNVNL